MIDIHLLKNISSAKACKDREIIIREGDAETNEMYIVLKGCVGIYKNYGEPGETRVASLDAGSFFGEMSLFLNEKRTATVIADGEVLVLAINRFNAYDFFEKQPEATFLLIKTLCARIEEMTNLHGKAKGVEGNKGAASDPAPVSRANVSAQTVSPQADIFPEGHKRYDLVYEPGDKSLLYEKKYTCPMCDHSFTALAIKTSALKTEKTDPDFRQRHKGIDTLYYEVLTCPSCFFSALTGSFESARESGADAMHKKLAAHRSQITLSLAGEKRDINELFACLYLALVCAPICFSRAEMLVAKLWLRLSWLYQDAGDEQMEAFALDKTRNAYVKVYEKITVPADQIQQLQVIIGEICFTLKDYDTARKYLYLAKTNKDGKPALGAQAQERIEAIREIRKKAAEKNLDNANPIQ